MIVCKEKDYKHTPALEKSKCLSVIMLLILFHGSSMSAVYYIDAKASNANDLNTGELSQPFKTIGKAATILQPGDTCLIREGIYRETINPARGGTSDKIRITYKAFPNENPVIAGSEIVTGWKKVSGNVYKAVVPNSFFGSYNPFAINVADSRNWLWHGKEYHLGDVYVNGDSYIEKRTQAAAVDSSKSWFASVSGSETTIWIHYSGTSSPSLETIEVNVRESVIRPATPGVSYLTIDGLTIRHGASQWANCCDEQRGMIDFNGGRSWIVRKCRISDARTSAIVSRGGSSTGYHLVQNNLIERCGQTGLAGNSGGWSFSIVEGNIIQDINIKDQFGGAETAGFKTHFPVDLIIRNNVFRRVKGSQWQFGIWLDMSAQGCRITGNVFDDLVSQAICLEVGHGPNLVDNNIFISKNAKTTIKTSSQNTIVVHNLFVNSTNNHYVDAGQRISRWYIPHTQTEAGKGQTPYLNDKYFNNIFIKGKNNLPQANQYESDFNVYLDQATPSTWGDKSSQVISTTPASFSVEHLTSGIKVQFTMNNQITALKTPLINKARFGSMSPTNQGLENPDGSPVAVDRDILGKIRKATNPTVGPFEDIQPGLNSYTIILNVPDSAKGTATLNRTKLKNSINKLHLLAGQRARVVDVKGREVDIINETGEINLGSRLGRTGVGFYFIYIVKNNKLVTGHKVLLVK